MQADEQEQPQDTPERQYAILRIKRKRNEEPLDGLVVDPEAVPRRKRSRGALNFFKFAETVDGGTWDDAKRKKDLEDRVAALASGSAKEGLTTSVSAPAIVEQAIESEPLPSTPRPKQLDDPNRRYTIIKRDVPASEPPVYRRAPNAPPKVWSTKELEALRESQSGLTVYDAVPSTSTVATSAEVDPQVAKFLPLLRDYLKIDDPTMATPPGSMSLFPTAAEEKTDDNDYVYDVFYQRPTPLQDLYVPGMSWTNIGTLTNVPEELMLYDSDEDSETYDTDDEDSNAEDWYKNDYPDEDPSDMSDGSEGSDVFHESSDYEDLAHADESDHEWR